MAALEPPGALPPRHVRTPLPFLENPPVAGTRPGDSRAREWRADRRFLLSSIRTSFRKYPKLLLSTTAVGSAAAAAVITLSAAPAAHPVTAQPAAVQSAGVQPAAAPAISRPMATLDAASISQARAAQRTAVRMLARFGWGQRQWKPLKWLWNRESGWNKYAENPYSGAYGIPQALPGGKMASAGNHWRTNATTQIRWGLRYIKSRYGRPRAAWNHSQAYGWY
jgi:hypothetical protein